MNKRADKIIASLILGLTVTFMIALTSEILKHSEHVVNIALFGAIISVIASKAYLLPFSFRKIRGIITDIDVETGKNTKSPNMKGVNLQNHGMRYKKDIVITLETEEGRSITKSFPFNGITERLRKGERISFTIFDDCPKVLN